MAEDNVGETLTEKGEVLRDDISESMPKQKEVDPPGALKEPFENAEREPLAALASSAEGYNIYGRIRGAYGQDTIFKEMLDQPEQFKNFKMSDGLLYMVEGDKKLLCVPDVKIGKRRVREIPISHGHTMLAHLGACKMTQYLREHVWWKTLNHDVQAFCKSCNLWAMTKARTTQ